MGVRRIPSMATGLIKMQVGRLGRYERLNASKALLS